MTSDETADQEKSFDRRKLLGVAGAAGAGALAGALGGTVASAVTDNLSDDTVASLLTNRDSKTRAATEILLQALSASIGENLARTTPGALRIEPGIGGVVGDGQVDDRAAIQQILDQAPRGATIVFGVPGSARAYRIDAPLVVNVGQLRIVGTGPDVYSSSLTTTAPITMLRVQASGLMLENLSFSISDPDSASVVGVEFFGSRAADIDAHVVRSSFMHLSRGIVMRGKNLRVENSLFSNGDIGIYVGGTSPEVHEKFESRNLIVQGNRFHSMGRSDEAAAILIGDEHKHQMSQFNSNFFDFGMKGKHILIKGLADDPHLLIQMVGNSHFHASDSAYHLENVSSCSISAAQIQGSSSSKHAGVAISHSHAVTVTDTAVRKHSEGFFVSDATQVQLRSVSATDNSRNGITLGDSVDHLVLDGVVSASNEGWGLAGTKPKTLHRGMIASYGNTAGDIDFDL